MEIKELGDLLTELSLFYERKEPKQNTIELWYRLVKNIPSEPLKWITKKIEENHETWPKNITAALWATYTEWQQTNPDKKSQQVFFDCVDCEEGLLFAEKRNDQNVNYSYVFRCSRCKQDHHRAYPVSSRVELMAAGYDVLPKEGNLMMSNKYKTIDDLKAAILRPIP